ncbi:MAG: hypothetical protein ACT4NY_02555 [Pseudonocardiales bacterium]
MADTMRVLVINHEEMGHVSDTTAGAVGATSGPHDREITEVSPLGQQDAACNYSPMSSAEPSAQWLAASLEEYKSLRAEIVDAIQAQRQIMQIGITGLSVLVGLGLQRIDPLLAVLLLMILVPMLAIFITAGALGEFFRAARASSFLAYREEIINHYIPGPASAQEWEQWLRLQPVYTVRDRAQFLATFSITTGALTLGFYTIFTSDFHIDQPVPLVFTLEAVAAILWAINPILYEYMLRRARYQFYQKNLSRRD